MAKLVTLVVPVGEGRGSDSPAQPVPAALAGRTVGFLDNTKANFDLLVEGLGGLLRERFGVARVAARRKANPSVPAAPELVAGLAKECDVVFAGSGD
jgi:hypothetical protein